ncbi:MAG: Hsp20/alpha crystallin family protein, partial [Burkholderiaceae bacterium]
DHADRLQRQFFRIAPARGGPCWEPPVDVINNGDRVTLLVALPGVPPDQFDVHLEDTAIVVRGERSIGASVGTGAIVRLEIPYGRFERRIVLAPGKYKLTNMLLENGCLRINLEPLP